MLFMEFIVFTSFIAREIRSKGWGTRPRKIMDIQVTHLMMSDNEIWSFLKKKKIKTPSSEVVLDVFILIPSHYCHCLLRNI